MRIIGGKFKGRRFSPPANNWPTRPTTDFAKEGLFNILSNRIDFEEVSMLDLFGGTGSHSYEAISRGCSSVTYVDRHYPCCQFVKKVARELGIQENIQVVRKDVGKFLKTYQREFDYIFAGPPYPLPWLSNIPDLIYEQNVLAQSGIFVLEHNPHHDFAQHPHFLELRKYGGTHFSFFGRSQEIDG